MKVVDFSIVDPFLVILGSFLVKSDHLVGSRSRSSLCLVARLEMVGLVGTQGTEGYRAWARAGGLAAYVTRESIIVTLGHL